MSYELTFSENEFLYCWNCGEVLEEAKMIHWQRSFHKEILCDECIGYKFYQWLGILICERENLSSEQTKIGDEE